MGLTVYRGGAGDVALISGGQWGLSSGLVNSGFMSLTTDLWQVYGEWGANLWALHPSSEWGLRSV